MAVIRHMIIETHTSHHQRRKKPQGHHLSLLNLYFYRNKILREINLNYSPNKAALTTLTEYYRKHLFFNNTVCNSNHSDTCKAMLSIEWCKSRVNKHFNHTPPSHPHHTLSLLLFISNTCTFSWIFVHVQISK